VQVNIHVLGAVLKCTITFVPGEVVTEAWMIIILNILPYYYYYYYYYYNYYYYHDETLYKDLEVIAEH
jgi:hypothetical protein